MATSPNPRPEAQPNMTFQLTPVQVGDRIMVQIQIGTSAGVTVTLLFEQAVTRQFLQALKEILNQAATTVIKPQSAIATA
jgi:hypothetical protein